MHIITHFFTLQVFLNIYLLISSVCSHHHYIKIDLPISAYSSAHLPIYSLIHNYIYIYIHTLYILCTSVNQSINQTIHLSISLSLSPSLSLALSLSLCVSPPLQGQAANSATPHHLHHLRFDAAALGMPHLTE